MAGDLSDFLSVTRSVSLVRPSATGFGTMLILSGTPYTGAGTGWNSSELTRVYSDADEVLDDFGATTPEYLSASAAFSSDDPPEEVVIGKYSVAPALKYSVGVATVTHSAEYKFTVNGDEVAYTADSATTNDEIVTGLKTALDALAISGLTTTTPGSAGSTRLQILGTAGLYFDVTLYDDDGVNYGPGANALSRLNLLVQTAEPATAVATQIANIRAERDTWYAVHNPYPGLPLNTAIAAYIEGEKKMFVALEPSTDAATAVLSGATDLAAAAKAASYGDTMVMVHTKPRQFIDAGWMGLMLPTEPGTDNWAMGTISGATADAWTSTHLSNIEDKNGNYYISVGGYSITRWGTMADGTYADLKRWIDKIEARMQEEVAALIVGASPGKIPQNQRGIRMVEGALYKALKHEADIGAIEPDFTLTSPKFEDLLDADKAVRLLTGFEASVIYTGAVNKAAVRLLVE